MTESSFATASRWLRPRLRQVAVRQLPGDPRGHEAVKVTFCVRGVLSPLLANIYLHPLDKYWVREHPETKLVRYCDDFVVLIRRRRPDGYLQDLKRFLEQMRLQLSEEKTRVVQAQQGFDFLGVRLVLKPTRRDCSRQFCYGFPSPKSMNRIRQTIREELGRDYYRSLQEKIVYLNPILRGWANYFSWLNSGEHFHKIGRYVMQRLNRWNRRKQQRVQRSYRKVTGRELYRLGLYHLTGTVAYIQ